MQVGALLHILELALVELGLVAVGILLKYKNTCLTLPPFRVDSKINSY